MDAPHPTNTLTAHANAPTRVASRPADRRLREITLALIQTFQFGLGLPQLFRGYFRVAGGASKCDLGVSDIVLTRFSGCAKAYDASTKQS
jgi:hypothetical protein